MRKFNIRWFYAVISCVVFYTLSSCNKMDSPTTPIEPTDDSEVVITDTTVLQYNLLGKVHEYVRVNYTYMSVDVDEVTPLRLSSAMVFSKDLFDRKLPKSVDKTDGKQYDATGLMLVAHFTIASGREAPTKTNDMELEGPVSAIGKVNEKNYILVSPDFSGFGVTEDKPQAYMIADLSARQALDALEAAKTALEKMNYTYGPKQVLTGYSQGAHTAVSIQRYLSMTSVVQPFDLICAGGGPYDLAGMVDAVLLPGAKTKYPCAIPLLLVETGEALQMGLDYSKVFCQPLGEKVVEWISSKQFTTTQINDSIAKVLNEKVDDGIEVSKILNLDYVSRSNPAMKEFFDIVEDNTLTSGWEPLTPARYYFYHSTQDEVVPFFCYENMVEYMLPKVSDQLIIEKNESVGGHGSAATMFVLMMFAKMAEI